LLKLTPRPVQRFLTEDENTARLPIVVAGAGVVEVTGVKSGTYMEYKLSFPLFGWTTPEERLEVYRRLGVTNIYTALPAVVGAKMCMRGNAKTGVICAECLNPIEFLKMMAETGWPLEFNETCSKKVRIS